MLRELHLERERINKAIQTLEAFQRLAAKTDRKLPKRVQKKSAGAAKT